MKYTDIKTYEDACKACNIDPSVDLPYGSPANAKQEALNAYAMMDTIIAAINDDPMFPDFTNYNQRKYNPVFYMEKKNAGFGFSTTRYDYWNTTTDVGERLVYNSSEKAEYAAKQFLPIYKKLMIK